MYTLRNFFCSEPSKFQKTGLKCIAFWRLALASYHFPLYIKRALISSAIPLYRSDIKALFISFIFLFLYHSFYDRLRIHFYLLHSDFFLLIFFVLFCKKYILSSTLRPALLEFSPEKWYNVKCIMINLLILINQFALLSDFLRRLKINSH